MYKKNVILQVGHIYNIIYSIITVGSFDDIINKASLS